MNPVLSCSLIIAALVLIIAALILRVCKLKTIGIIVELVGIACFVAFTSQYAYHLGHLADLSLQAVGELILFFFSVAFGVYKVLFFFVLPKR